jgi:hypothetical protein
MVIWEGSLYRGLSSVILIPTIWEVDDQRASESSNDPGRTALRAPGGRWNEAGRSVLSLTEVMAKLAADPKADYTSIVSRAREGFSQSVVIAKQAAGEPLDRPVGMKDRGDRYVFQPEVFVLTYDLAQELAGRRLNGAPGVFAVNYRDEGQLSGDYTLYLRVERR